MRISRRHLFIGAAAATTIGALRSGPGCAAQPAAGGTFTPEMFGAKGDGVANDTDAFAELADAVNANGGGTVEFRRTTYLVGRQFPALRRGAAYSFEPARLLDFKGCRKPLILRGNGARIRCADGLRYGTFDASGRPTRHKMPFYGREAATPYRAMILVADCSGPVEIADFELDGNVGRLRIGGEHGDTGWQIPAAGITLLNNRGDEIVRNIHSHHHGWDGLYIDGDDRAVPRLPKRLISGVRSEYNGRQGCSIVGGRGYVFDGCKFNHTGRANVASAPGAGVDIEAEGGKTNRDFTFVNCEFANNHGCGMVADSGDSEGAAFKNCTFVGTINWAAWPRKPRFRFDGCTFAGSLANAYGDPDRRRAAQFHGCTFTDDPRRSPGGKLSFGGKAEGTVADLSETRNVLFSRCAFLLRGAGVLPWSVNVIYADCRMEQRSKIQGYPRGTFIGRTTINGNVDLYGSNVVGEVILNGNRIAARKL